MDQSSEGDLNNENTSDDVLWILGGHPLYSQDCVHAFWYNRQLDFFYISLICNKLICLCNSFMCA